jgi:predicted GH43/DUF377 family glycosyl hydrolase
VLKLERLSHDPILTPDPHNSWESGAVFNCGAIHFDQRIQLIYRATDVSSNGAHGTYINSLGYAYSSDGLNFKRKQKPIMGQVEGQEARGPEDPRLVELEGTFYMTYTGFGGRFEGDYRICLAKSDDLVEWERLGVLLDEPNKDAALFPERIGGQFAMLHRRPPDIWIAYSQDLINWDNHQIVMKADAGADWERLKIGAAGPPIRSEMGWILIYHGVSEEHRYSLGIALLQADDPTRILARQIEPILEPELEWEVYGHVPNVVFSCGHVLLEDRLLVYYGAADTVIGVAETDLPSIERSFLA